MISIVIPTLNRGNFLPELVRTVKAAAVELGRPYEIIVVDDGSGDDTHRVLRQLCLIHRELRAVVLAGNSGQQNATLAGIRAARYPYVLTLDDDLEYDLGALAPMVSALDQGWDAVYVVGASTGASPFRRMGTAVKELLLVLLAGKPPELRLTSFRGLSGASAAFVSGDTSRKVYLSARLLQYTRNILNLHSSRICPKGDSRYRPGGLVRLVWQIVRNYSPLAPWLKDLRPGEQYVIKELLP